MSAALAALSDEIAEAVSERVLAQLADVIKPQARPSLLSRQELAQELGCGVDLIDKMRKRGMPTVMLCDSPRFELDAVLAWMKSRRKQT